MNDIKRLRLQNQIFRHVATYYQKMAGAKNARATLENVTKAESNNPFEAVDPDKFTQQVTDYCTFTRCELSSDGSFAKIFVSVWGDAKEQDRILKEIKRLVPGMRSSIAKNIRMRAIPQLTFVQDLSFEKAGEVNKLI
ncbi:MAG: 30S ribosome-binding factor RbfA [Spirochaetes bacterium]|nr:30S ribosome-binding factor RbfA [Spirochaetota bacterium]MBX3722026.1 30S ribosome-binding factor RbfA [Turneriella sp.]